ILAEANIGDCTTRADAVASSYREQQARNDGPESATAVILSGTPRRICVPIRGQILRGVPLRMTDFENLTGSHHSTHHFAPSIKIWRGRFPSPAIHWLREFMP